MKRAQQQTCFLLAFNSRTLLVMCCLIMVVTTAGISAEPDFNPLIEKHPDGWIDWDQGVIYGIGKGYLHLNDNSRNKALRAAKVLALQSILKVAAGIRLDDRETLETLGKGQVVIHLRGFIRFTEHQSIFKAQEPRPYHEVTLRAPLNGIEGLTSNLLQHLKSKPQMWQDFPIRNDRKLEEQEDQPWLVLDARPLSASANVQPALFPKIITPSGEVIYELKSVNAQALAQRGMARYVVSDTPTDKLQARTNRLDDILDRIDTFISLREAHAEEKKKRRKRRRFIVKQVNEAQGLMRTNLVISENDARQLTDEDASSQILKKCRVIVIAASPIGGIEGQIMRYFASNLDP